MEDKINGILQNPLLIEIDIQNGAVSKANMWLSKPCNLRNGEKKTIKWFSGP